MENGVNCVNTHIFVTIEMSKALEKSLSTSKIHGIEFRKKEMKNTSFVTSEMSSSLWEIRTIYVNTQVFVTLHSCQHE